MEYIKNSDYEYIMNKYHDQSKPFNSFSRFIRRDEIFDTSTGLDGDFIKEEIMRRDEKNKDLPHPVRKANAFAYVLENTRISCDSRDIFHAINMVDRPLGAITVKWKKEVFEEIIPQIGEKRSYFEKHGIVTMWPDFDHSVPMWERVFGLGFKGLLTESERIRKSKTLNGEQEAFFEGIKITYEAILKLLERLYILASKTKGSEKLAKALKNIKENPPSSFYEMLLVDYLYFVISEHIEGLQVRSLSNFDRIFYPMYKKDLENGVTEEEIRTDLAYFLLQFTSIGNYWNQPVFLGGCKEDESTEINELSYLFLDVYDKMCIYNPKVQIKIAESTPKEFVLKALDMIRRGNNCIVFVCDATIRKALMKVGCTADEARLCNIKGCYEYSIQGSMGCGMNYLNMLKPLEYTLHQGCDGITGHFAGLKSPDISTFDTFDKLYDEYKKQFSYLMDQTVEIVNAYEQYLSYMNPMSMLSATYPTCLESGKDALNGGSSRNGTGMEFGFLADIADSMAMLKKYVYDQKELALSEFVEILDKNYEGHEAFRMKLLCDPDKYGNNRDLPDNLAKDIFEFATTYICGKPNASNRGGKWNAGFHVARMSYDQAPKTAASPNGRIIGDELAKNCSASMGQNKGGCNCCSFIYHKIRCIEGYK